MSAGSGRRRPYVTVDVFTERGFAGNPLAVFPDGAGLTAAQMGLLAREFNYSEAAFFLPAEQPGHDARLRIFTPARELPFAGHPTVGSAVALAEVGRLPLAGGRAALLIEEEAGVVPVSVWQEPGRPLYAELTAPQLPRPGPPPPPADTLARLLSLAPGDLAAGADCPEAYSAGVPFLFVPVEEVEAVERIRFDTAVWRAALADYWAPQVYAFSRQTRTPGASVHARMFSPAFGIPEDNATGAAAVALAGYLAKRHGSADGTISYTVEQGLELGRPSVLRGSADLRAGRLAAVRVGGHAVLISEGEMEVPG